MSIATQEHPEATAPALAFVALLVGNAALAAGPWFVRVADSGPVAAGFWRLAIALPILATLAWHERRGEQAALPHGLVWLVVAAGVFFAFDLASWHVGIEQTRLANATLFGNSGSLLIMGWGLVLLRRWPTAKEGIAVIGALAGAAILLSRSLEIDPRFVVGDLLCILAGLLYTFYILFAQRARDAIGNWTLLAIASAAGAPVPRSIGAACGVGSRVQVHSLGGWRPGKVIETRGAEATGAVVPQIYVHFDGRAKRFDEWLPLSSKRIGHVSPPPAAPASAARKRQARSSAGAGASAAEPMEKRARRSAGGSTS